MADPRFPRGGANSRGSALTIVAIRNEVAAGNVFTPVCDSVQGGGVCPVGSLSGKPAIRLRAGGTHPTGMHSCFKKFCQKPALK